MHIPQSQPQPQPQPNPNPTPHYDSKPLVESISES